MKLFFSEVKTYFWTGFGSSLIQPKYKLLGVRVEFIVFSLCVIFLNFHQASCKGSLFNGFMPMLASYASKNVTLKAVLLVRLQAMFSKQSGALLRSNLLKYKNELLARAPGDTIVSVAAVF